LSGTLASPYPDGEQLATLKPDQALSHLINLFTHHIPISET